ncbi:RluA family pseudouridine synthase [[Pseudomonas] carboxydohydrogena]|uniref:RluA family pseudouridine synthase n=1 Tax=Afipia carboxydohydrogena TaxID=290 RepID=UPI0023AEBC46|nr:RluA family pseudouridine synthase [[Pseudomonas] carboxydohydrogena]
MQGSSSNHRGAESTGERRIITAPAAGKSPGQSPGQSQRLDRVLAEQVEDLSRTRLKALIVAGHVSIGGAPILDPAYQVKADETIIIEVPPAVPPEPEGENIPLDIVYEDDDLLVLNKPKGLVVHPAAGHETGTLVNALIAHCGASLSGIGGVKRPGIVHRLDKDTTGLMVVAKNDRAHQSLTAQFADHGRTGALRRGYMAFVWGAPSRPHGTIDQPIDRHPFAREKMAVRQGGRHAITHWEMLESFEGADGKPLAALLACQLETGRTHQIRVHLGHIGHPLIGDDVYGSGFRTKANHLGGAARTVVAALGRQALHAYLLQIEHPATGEIMNWQSGLPEDLVLLQSALRAAA